MEKITHVDYAILGLLSEKDMSGYEIRMVFERTALGNFSSSPGTIYPALKRLLRLGVVEKIARETKAGELFSISKKGLKLLKDWILKPVGREDIIKGLDPIYLRVAFMDATDDAKQRRKFFETLYSAVESYVSDLERFYSVESKNIPQGGRLAFERGLEIYKSSLKWIQKAQSTYEAK